MRYLFLHFFHYYVTLITAANVLPKRYISPLRMGLKMHKFAQSYSPLEIKRDRIRATSLENLPIRRAIMETRDLEKLFDKNGVIYLGSLPKAVPEFDASENQGSSREIQDFKELLDKNGIIYLSSPKIVPAFKMSKKSRQEAYGENLHDTINNFKDGNDYWHKGFDKSKVNPDVNHLSNYNKDNDRRKEENNAVAVLLKALRFDKSQPKATFEFSELVA